MMGTVFCLTDRTEFWDYNFWKICVKEQSWKKTTRTLQMSRNNYIPLHSTVLAASASQCTFNYESEIKIDNKETSKQQVQKGH